jgi:hypothetical protein
MVRKSDVEWRRLMAFAALAATAVAVAVSLSAAVRPGSEHRVMIKRMKYAAAGCPRRGWGSDADETATGQEHRPDFV